MKIIESIKVMKALSRQFRLEGKTLGFVPTMGCLHEGHLSLVRKSLEECDITIVSIFLNPRQFGKNEDLDMYPSSKEKDREQLENFGIDVLFCPKVNKIFPEGFKTNLVVEDITNRLCGKKRPNLFRGVATVVLKFFNIIQPDEAFFGEKDRQQLEVIRTITRDLNLDVKIKSLPLIRENGGLAMSSRNRYLTKSERHSALSLSRALETAKTLIKKGEISAQKLKEEMSAVILKEPHTQIEYISICDPNSFADREQVSEKAVIALAVNVGRARLIDNCIVEKV